MFIYRLKEENGMFFLMENKIRINYFETEEEAIFFCKKWYGLDFSEVYEIRR